MGSAEQTANETSAFAPSSCSPGLGRGGESCSRCDVLYVRADLIYISSNKLFSAIMSQQDP